MARKYGTENFTYNIFLRYEITVRYIFEGMVYEKSYTVPYRSNLLFLTHYR